MLSLRSMPIRFRPENKENLVAECKAADIIILTYACDAVPPLTACVPIGYLNSADWRSFHEASLNRELFWKLVDFNLFSFSTWVVLVKVPVLVVGCRLDLWDDQ